MTSNGDNGNAYRVRVVEHRSAALTGLENCEYASPAHTPEQAHALLRVLLGRDPDPTEREWCLPIAGGSRRIALLEASHE